MNQLEPSLVTIPTQSVAGGPWPELVDILRTFSRRDSAAVSGYTWEVLFFDGFCFEPKNLDNPLLSTDWSIQKGTIAERLMIAGDDLLRASVMVSQTEAILAFRRSEHHKAVIPHFDVDRLTTRLPSFQASGTDLEIRKDEGPWEVVMAEREAASHLLSSFRRN